MSTLADRVQALSPAQRAQLAQQLARRDAAGPPRSRRLVACVVPRDGGKTTPEEIRHFLRERLPEYMIPAAFVWLDETPRTPNGKVDRQDLDRIVRERLAEPAEEFVAPRSETEQLLAKIWAEVLGFDLIGVHDNFFEVGGDSILGIQIIARAHQAGLVIAPQQLFQHLTIAELAAVARQRPVYQAEQGPVTGLAPLTPIQHWFFEQGLARPAHWGQALLLETPPDLDLAALRGATALLLAHHDALRLKFRPVEGGWEQLNPGPGAENPLRPVNLAGLTPAERAAAIKERSAELQAGLRLDGPLTRFVYFDPGPGEAGRLLIVAHHLVVDSVSWRLLQEDLQTAYDQLAAGAAPSLPAKTTSFRQWARRLVEYARSDALADESEFWLQADWCDETDLPLDLAADPAANTVGTAQEVTGRLSTEETRQLLVDVPAVYQTRINDLLLTALGLTWRDWSGRSALCFGLEGHGREPLFDDLDLSRTVGWFTSFFPVRLRLDQGDPGAAIRSVKEQLRAVPGQGIGYGLLRYLRADAAIARALAGRPQPRMTFNYLGQFRSDRGKRALFPPALEPTGVARYPGDRRLFQLEVEALVADEALQVTWRYSDRLHHQSTIARLGDNYLRHLRALINHCLTSDGGYTPSDFALAGLDQVELDRLAGLLDDLDAAAG